MSKKILLLVFFSFLIIIPAGNAGAAQYYIGVAIASGQAPGNPSTVTNTNWCLPRGTTLHIRNSSGTDLPAITPTVNPTEISRPGCAGRTIWSALFNLTSGTTYQIYIFPAENFGYYAYYYYGYCSGSADPNYSGECLVTWPTAGQDKNCTEVCAYYGSTADTGARHEQNCNFESFLMGATCSSCTANATYNYYDPTTRACFYTTTDGASATARLGATLERVCRCPLTNNNTYPNFTFTFTPSF